MPTKKETTKKETPRKKGFTFSLEMEHGETYTAEGKDPVDAAINLNVNHMELKSAGTFRLEAGGAKAEKLYYMRPLKRVVVNRLMRAQVGRNLAHLLKGAQYLTT